MLIKAVWAILLVSCLAQINPDPQRVATLTQQFAEAIKKQDGSVAQFYDTDALLTVEPALGYGGHYKGPRGVELFVYRMLQAVTNDQPVQINIFDVDEDRGTALLTMDVSGVFERTGKEFDTRSLNVLEWNQVSGKIMTHVSLDVDPSRTLAAYQTDAESNFERLLWTLFRTSYEQITDVNSPIWNLISDNVIVKLNAYPEDLLSKSMWQGKSEVVKGFTEMQELKQNMPLYIQMMTRTEKLDAKVLVSNDTDVWVRWGCKREDNKLITHVVVHYGFDTDGKLVYEEITLAHAARPWQVYPFPAPKQPVIASREARKLKDATNLAADESKQSASTVSARRLTQGVSQGSQSVQTVPFQKLSQDVFEGSQNVSQGAPSTSQGISQGIQSPQGVSQDVSAQGVFAQEVQQQPQSNFASHTLSQGLRDISHSGNSVPEATQAVQTVSPQSVSQLHSVAGSQTQKVPLQSKYSPRSESVQGVPQVSSSFLSSRVSAPVTAEFYAGQHAAESADTVPFAQLVKLKEHDKLHKAAFEVRHGKAARAKEALKGEELKGDAEPAVTIDLDLDVGGDMKTSIVHFGDGRVGKVKFVGMIDELEVEQPKLMKQGPVFGMKLDGELDVLFVN